MAAKKTLEQVAREADEIFARHAEVPSMGYEPAGPDPGERAVERLAEENGFTLDEVLEEINIQSHADDGPYGRIE